jgi:hypothetical protein
MIGTSRPRCTHRTLAILLNSNMTTTINLTARAMGTHSSNMEDMKTTHTMQINKMVNTTMTKV